MTSAVTSSVSLDWLDGGNSKCAGSSRAKNFQDRLTAALKQVKVKVSQMIRERSCRPSRPEQCENPSDGACARVSLAQAFQLNLNVMCSTCSAPALHFQLLRVRSGALLRVNTESEMTSKSISPLLRPTIQAHSGGGAGSTWHFQRKLFASSCFGLVLAAQTFPFRSRCSDCCVLIHLDHHCDLHA